MSDTVKISTREKFNVATPISAILTDTSAADLCKIVLKQLEGKTKNVIINLENTKKINPGAAEQLAEIYPQFVEAEASLVFCCLQPQVKETFDSLELLDVLNTTPTESEAWDIVQMEEIERELLNGTED